MKTVEQLIIQSLTTAESETHAQFHTQILRTLVKILSNISGCCFSSLSTHETVKVIYSYKSYIGDFTFINSHSLIHSLWKQQ